MKLSTCWVLLLIMGAPVPAVPQLEAVGPTTEVTPISPPSLNAGQWTQSRADAACSGYASTVKIASTVGFGWAMLDGGGTGDGFAENYPIAVSTIYGPRVYAGSDGGISCRSAEGGALIWRYTDPVRGFACEVTGTGSVRIYYATKYGEVICLEDRDRHPFKRWENLTTERYYSRSSLVVANGKVLLVGADVDPALNLNGNTGLVAFTKDTGDLLFFEVTGGVSANDPDDDYLTEPPPSVNTATGRIYTGINPLRCYSSSGDLVWTRFLTGYGSDTFSTVVDSLNDRVLVINMAYLPGYNSFSALRAAISIEFSPFWMGSARFSAAGG